MKHLWLFTAAITLVVLLAGCGKQVASTPPTPPPVADATNQAQPVPEPAPKNVAAAPTKKPAPANPKPVEIPGLIIMDIKIGKGATAETGDLVSVHYTGRLTNGTKFDSSLDRKKPFEFQLGAGNVIEGWDKGVVGMKVGGKRKLVISPELGYGESGNGPIPPNSTLVFDIELLAVK